MSRFNVSDIGNYDVKPSGKFFTLKNDKDVARVRILYESAEDIDGYAVHRVSVDGRDRYINCLREYNDPMGKCPFCANGMKVQPKLFVPLYNEDTQELQFWERGSTFSSQLSGLVARYKNIVSRTFDIERNGAKGDTKTTYQFYPVDEPDGTTVQDILDDLGLSEMPTPVGTIIMDKSAEEMQAYIDNGSFPEGPVRRRSERAAETTDEAPVRRGRRTPANNDTF